MAVPALKTRRSSLRRGLPLRRRLPNALHRALDRQRLLSTPICKLNLQIEGVLAECVGEVKAELRAAGITFVPNFYLGDEDFWTTDRAISINLPWYLANDSLWRLVNGPLNQYTREEVSMYVRHEVGHALNYAFRLWKRADWTRTFGDFKKSYDDVYEPDPWSRDHVRYLHRTGMYHYAQKHPDEDFAETFAVWLDPSSRWRRRYADWPGARAKIEFVDRLVREEGAMAGRPSNRRVGQQVPYTKLTETVAEYFKLGVDPKLAAYRRDLCEIFPRRRARRGPVAGAAVGRTQTNGLQPASRFIQQYHDLLEERLGDRLKGAATLERRVVRTILRRLQAICTHEQLVVPSRRRNEKLVDLTIMATWHALAEAGVQPAASLGARKRRRAAGLSARPATVEGAQLSAG
jgi:hypothetical protein